MHSHKFQAIGTDWTIDTARPLTADEKQQLAETIEDFDHTYSRFRRDSLVWLARQQAPGEFVFPASIGTLFETYQKLDVLTDGRVNPLIGGSLEQLGYDADYSLQTSVPQPAPVFSETAQLHEITLTLTQPTLLDVGAIGKGLVVDIIVKQLANNHDEFVVDASGDMAVHTSQPEIIGLEHPADPSKVVGVVRLAAGSLCGSATNRRAWGDGLHHIIDATTGRPLVTNIIATWAIAPTTMLADALTTALFFAQPEDIRHVFSAFQYVVLLRDGTVHHNLTPDSGELFV